MSTKSTRIALVASLTALVLCVAMLIGTTFAWFTDNVSTAKNNIVAGNLDVELEYLDGAEWKTVTETTSIFNDAALWEPGYTEVAYLKVVNKGTLAFDYNMGVNIVAETAGVNVAGETFNLSDYIYMGAVEDASTAFASREAARAAVTGAKAISAADYTKVGTLKAAEVKYVALVVYMPETVGNEANYRGATVPTIELGINILATQETYESDDFGNDYDDPTVPSEKTTMLLNVYDAFDTGKPAVEKEVTFDVYTFDANEYETLYPMATYKDWTCDFFVSSDKAINDGLVLAGQYDAWSPDWLGFWVPVSTEPYEPTGLLGAVTRGGASNWTYEEICGTVKVFNCGIIDTANANAGTKITVDLILTSPDGTQKIPAKSITVTLG